LAGPEAGIALAMRVNLWSGPRNEPVAASAPAETVTAAVSAAAAAARVCGMCT